MKTIEYLICAPKTFGIVRKLHPRLGGTTKLDARLNCQSYVCRSYAEWATMNKDVVGHTWRNYWCAVQVRDTETGEVSDPPADFTLSAASAMVGAAEENPTGPAASRPSQPDPVGVPIKRSASFVVTPETPEELHEEIFGTKVTQPIEGSDTLPPPPTPPAKPAPVTADKRKPGRPAKAK